MGGAPRALRPLPISLAGYRWRCRSPTKSRIRTTMIRTSSCFGPGAVAEFSPAIQRILIVSYETCDVAGA